MGGKGSGRLNKTNTFLKKNSDPFKSVGNVASVGDEVLVIPNHSGMSSHPEVTNTFLKIDGSNANTTIDIGSQDFTTTGTGTVGDGVFGEGAIINANTTNVNYLELKGRGAAATAKGGGLQWYSDPSIVSGYVFMNTNNQMVFSDAAQVSADDVGKAWIRLTDGDAFFDGEVKMNLITDTSAVTIQPNLTVSAPSVPKVTIDASEGTGSRGAFVLRADRGYAGQAVGDFNWFNDGATAIANIIAFRGTSDIKGELGFFTSNSERMRIDEDGAVTIPNDLGVGSTTSSGTSFFKGTTYPVLEVGRYASSTNSMLATLKLTREVNSGVGANGVGAAIQFESEDSAGNLDPMAMVGARFNSATSGAETAEVVIIPAKNGDQPYNDTPTLTIRATTAGGNEEIIIDSDNKLYASSGTFDFDNDHLTTTGDITGNVFKSGASTGVSGTFTTADSKTVTVTNGIITAIV